MGWIWHKVTNMGASNKDRTRFSVLMGLQDWLANHYFENVEFNKQGNLPDKHEFWYA